MFGKVKSGKSQPSVIEGKNIELVHSTCTRVALKVTNILELKY